MTDSKEFADAKKANIQLGGVVLAVAGGLVALVAPHPAAKLAGGVVGLAGGVIGLAATFDNATAANEAAQGQNRPEGVTVVGVPEIDVEKLPDAPIDVHDLPRAPTDLGDVDAPGFDPGAPTDLGDVDAPGFDPGAPTDLGDVDAPGFDPGGGGQSGGISSGGVGTGCFALGTLVATEHGLLPIEQVAAGLQVKTFETVTERQQVNQVLEVFKTRRQEFVVLEIPGEQICCTPLHRFRKDEDWVAARDLQAGDKLVALDGTYVSIVAVTAKHERQVVFNLHVESTHNYFVGASSVLVHNLKDNEGEGEDESGADGDE